MAVLRDSQLGKAVVCNSEDTLPIHTTASGTPASSSSERHANSGCHTFTVSEGATATIQTTINKRKEQIITQQKQIIENSIHRGALHANEQTPPGPTGSEEKGSSEYARR